jgi:hypothetical protein
LRNSCQEIAAIAAAAFCAHWIEKAAGRGDAKY